MTDNSPPPLLTPTPTSPAGQAGTPDPLAQLQDIHTPPDIGIWPPAWGWWLVALLTITMVGAAIFFMRRRRQRNHYRQQALAELHQLNRLDANQNGEWLQALSILLRRTAIAGCGPQFDTGLKGNAWLVWLDERCPACNMQFSQGSGTALLAGPYQKNPECDRAALEQLAQTWIREHRNRWQKVNNNNNPGGQNV